MIISLPPFHGVFVEWLGACGVAGGRDVHHRSPFDLVMRALGVRSAASHEWRRHSPRAAAVLRRFRALRAEKRDARPGRQRERHVLLHPSLLSRLEGEIARTNEP